MTFPSFDQAAAGGLELWAGQQLAARLGADSAAAAELYTAWASSRGVQSERARQGLADRLASDRFRAKLNGHPLDLEPPTDPGKLLDWVSTWGGSELDPLGDLVELADERNALRRYVRACEQHAAQTYAAQQLTGSERRIARASAAAAARQRDELHDQAALFVASLGELWLSTERPTYTQPQPQAVPAGRW